MEKGGQGSAVHPGEILGLSGAYWRSFALHAAVRLDLFTALGEEQAGSAEVAARVKADPRGVETLMNALAALGLLEKREGRFANTPAGRAFLVRGSPRFVGYMIRHHANLVASWAHLDEAVREGRPVRQRSAGRPGAELEDFIMGMHNNTAAFAPRAAGEVDLRGRRRLLDLGGGPGTWSIAFALANPGLRATVFDLPATRPFAERTIAGAGVADRVSFAAGDFVADELPRGHDAAWLSHILHGEGPETARAVVAKAAAALEPGGMLLVHEFILDEDKASPAFPALFSLNMLLGTPEGRSYSRVELEEMLAGAGARDIRLLPFRGPTESRILAGVVPAGRHGPPAG